MKKIYYRKLIRDKIPQLITDRGSKFKIRTLKVKDFWPELIKKVSEEVSGLRNARNKQELIAELADVVDVIDEIKRHKKITSSQLDKARRKNQRRKGGFRQRFFLVWSADDGYQTNERRNSS